MMHTHTHTPRQHPWHSSDVLSGACAVRRGARWRDASCCAELLLRELAAALGVEPHNDKKMEVLQQVQG